jgi:hypothetical protein
MYYHLYYEEKIKDVLKDRWLSERHLEDDYNADKPSDHPTMKFRNQVTRDLYDAESDDVKEEVEKHRNGEATEEEEEEEEEEEGFDEAMTKRRNAALKHHK